MAGAWQFLVSRYRAREGNTRGGEKPPLLFYPFVRARPRNWSLRPKKNPAPATQAIAESSSKSGQIHHTQRKQSFYSCPVLRP